MKTEIVKNLPADQYFASQGLSKHRLDDFAKAPLVFKRNEGKEFKPSRSMQLGTCVHSYTLEGRTEWAVAPECDRRTTAGKQLWAQFSEENEGMLIVNAEEGYSIQGACRSAVDLIGELVGTDNVENSLYWERDGIQCKGRIDLIAEFSGQRCLYDIKTTSDILSFERDFYKYRYDIQASWYTHGYKSITGEDCMFAFIVVDMNDPFLNQIVIPNQRTMDKAEASIEGLLQLYKNCCETNSWPGLPLVKYV